MNPEINNPEAMSEGAKMLGTSNFDMLAWEKNRQMYNPGPASEEKPTTLEQEEDVRDFYKRQRSMLYRLKRAIGME